MDSVDTLLSSTIETLRSHVPEHLLSPKIGIVCGSGLSTLANSIRDVHQVPYSLLEGFGKSTVQGHKSALAFGLIGEGDGVPVVAMLGRFHPYEGHSLQSVVYPIRFIAKLGVKSIIITNAAGTLDPNIPIGTIVVIQDHIALPNLTGPLNPLLGPLTRTTSSRFIPLSTAYSPMLRRLAFLASHKLGFASDALTEGVYAWVSGPTYETPAEGRLLRLCGAAVVGMSTVPEVVAARDEGMQVCVLSLVTNKVVIPDRYRSIQEEVEAELAGRPFELPKEAEVSHQEVLDVGRSKADDMKRLVECMIDLHEK